MSSILVNGGHHSPRRASFAVSFDVKETPHHERRDSQFSSYRRKSSFNGLFSHHDWDEESFKDERYNEDNIRRRVFGQKLLDIKLGSVDTSVSRPTISSARRSVLWSRQRIMYEENNKKNTQEFNSQPYQYHKYPCLKKHYPGTWRVATEDELKAIVVRLTKSTFLSRVRSAPVTKSRRYEIPVRMTKSAPV